MIDLFVGRRRGQWRGRAEEIHNIRPKKINVVRLLAFLEHGNGKITG